MANVDHAHGLRPVAHMTGGTPMRMNEYTIDSGSGSIFTGDPVKSDTTNGGKNIVQAGASDRLTGVFAGCEYISASGKPTFSQYWPTGTSIQTGSTVTAYVYDDPRLLFEIQADASVAATDIRNNADINIGTGDTATGLSGAQLDVGTQGAAKVLKIMELVNRPDNDYGANADLVVMISKHELAGAATGV